MTRREGQRPISGGHSVAKALENEGVDTIFTLCGATFLTFTMAASMKASGSCDVPFGTFAEIPGGYGEEVRDPAAIAPALRRTREEVAKRGKSAVINIWVDPREYAPGTKALTLYK